MAVIKKYSPLISAIQGKISEKVIPAKPQKHFTTGSRTSKKHTILYSYTPPSTPPSSAQLDQRHLFSQADCLWKNMTIYQKEKFVEYIQQHPELNPDNVSYYNVFVRLYITGQLSEFYRDYLGLRCGKIGVALINDTVHYILYVRSKQWEYWTEPPIYGRIKIWL